MTIYNFLFLSYAFLMAVGGVMGYKKAGSKMSLYSGLVSGVLILAGVILSGTNQKFGFGLIAFTALSLTVVFILRFIKTKQFMPTGMLMLLNLIALLVSLRLL